MRMLTRWKRVVRADSISYTQLSRSYRDFLAVRCRCYPKPAVARLPLGQRRALCTLYQKKSFLPIHTLGLPSSVQYPPLSSRKDIPDNPILHSAFPTKTVLAILIIGGLAYYFVDIVHGSWESDVFSSFVPDDRNQNVASPLHFNDNKEDVHHWLQFHIPDLAAPYKDPELAKLVSDQFENVAFGWMLTGEEADKEGIPNTHGCRLRSNEPCEDYFAIGTSPGPGEKPWNFWSVMDGHAGRHTALYLQWSLIPYLSSALLALPASTLSPEIVSTIKQTFLRLDEQIMNSARTAANWFPAGNAAAQSSLAPALSGSCALLAAFDPDKSLLRVACVGDSRAVLGRWDPASQSYQCIPLSEDQTGYNPKEVERLNSEHPDEPDVIDSKSGRVLGIAISRAFGDARWKWERDLVRMVYGKFWGDSPRNGVTTPPYLTAEPEITETQIVSMEADEKNVTEQAATRSDFMIMASDGLWDRISSEHAVECISRYLEAKARGSGFVKQDPHLLANPPSFLPPTASDPGIDLSNDYVSWKATPEYFAIEDENAAVCLARNALGGSRRNLFLGVLTLHQPWRRNAHDDMTVLVVFFDKAKNIEAGESKKKSSREGSCKRSWWPW